MLKTVIRSLLKIISILLSQNVMHKNFYLGNQQEPIKDENSTSLLEKTKPYLNISSSKFLAQEKNYLYSRKHSKHLHCLFNA